MKEVKLSNNSDERIVKIADSIYAYWNLFPVDQVNIIPFIDNLKNLEQDRIIICFCKKEQSNLKLLFHTFQDPFYESGINEFLQDRIHKSNEFEIIDLDSEYSLTIFKLEFAKNLKMPEIIFSKKVQTSLSDLIHLLKNNYNYKSLFIEAIDILKKRNDNLKRFVQPIKKTIATSFEFDKDFYKNKIRNLIEECILDVEESLLLKKDLTNKISIPNLFTVIAYPSNEKRLSYYNYTAQILLTKKQKKNINKWSNENISDILETPLSKNSRSITDTPFCTGYVEYNATAGHGRDFADHTNDKGRQAAEDKLYYCLTKEVEPNKRVVNFIPLFLNGSPWIVLYSLHSKSSSNEDSWNQNYFIYRDLISKIGTSIRIKAKDLFIEIIQSIMQYTFEECSDANKYVEKINLKMEELSCFFPFPVPNFIINTTNYDNRFYIAEVELSESAPFINNYWYRYVDYDEINIEDLFKIVQVTLKRLNDQLEAKSRLDDKITSSYGLSHFYGNRLKLVSKQRSEAVALLRSKYEFDKETDSLLKDSYEQFKTIEEISELLTIISKQHTAKSKGSFFQNCNKDYLNDEGVYDIKKNFFELSRRILNPTEQTITFGPKSAYITFFIMGKCRPYNVLYDNLLLEVLQNFKNVKAPNLIIGIDEKENCIYFKNIIIRDSKLHYSENWEQINPNRFSGAIYYFHLLLENTKIGEVIYCYEPCEIENMIYYKCGLKLKGLTYEN